MQQYCFIQENKFNSTVEKTVVCTKITFLQELFKLRGGMIFVYNSKVVNSNEPFIGSWLWPFKVHGLHSSACHLFLPLLYLLPLRIHGEVTA